MSTLSHSQSETDFHPGTLFADSKWIWPENHHWDIHNSYALFRKECTLPRVPRHAPLFLTADQSYQLWINGQYVCRGPARGFQHSWPYDEIYVAAFLRRGKNLIAIRAYNPGYSNFQYLTQGFAGVLLSARWGRVRIVSDASWKSRRQSSIMRDAARTSMQLFSQEHADLRIESPDWMMPDFEDSDWNARTVEHPWNGMPWYSLEPRGIPMLEEKLTAPLRCIGQSTGKCATDFRTARDVARLRAAEKLSHRPADLSANSLSCPASGKNHFQSYLFDFGHTVVGSLCLEISGATGGEILDTLYVETIEPATLTPHYVPDKHCRMAFANRLICRAGNQSYAFFPVYGFRYVVVTVRVNPAPLSVRLSLRTAIYPMEVRGAFRSSEASLQSIWEACAWTQRVCSMDAYVDTPWREQAQWWGDARVQAKNTFFLSGDTRLFRRGIKQIAGQTTPGGLTYGHAPTMAHNCILPDFTLIWLITLWDFYWQTGSLEPFLAHQETISRALAYFEEMTDPDTGLVRSDDRYWLFLDWSGEFLRKGFPSVLNLWLLIALQHLETLHRLAGQHAEAARLHRRSTRLRQALLKLTTAPGLLRDGISESGKISEGTSVHTQTLAILAGLQPRHDAKRIRDVLVPALETTPGLSHPSPYWIHYVFEVLDAHGHDAEVVEFIQKHWAPMAAHGTTWEVWNPRLADESFSHAWSAHPLFHLMQIVGGIRQTAPAWRQITFHPHFIGSECHVTVPTPQGSITGRWSRTRGRVNVSLDLPKGVCAEIHLPGTPPTTVTKHSSWRLDIQNP